jgi:phosphohistidine swiveling domain-containing protein
MKEELSFLNVQSVLDLYSSLSHLDVEEIFKENIGRNKKFYRYTEAIKLPNLLISPDDIYGYFLEDSSPNFITSKKIQARIVTETDFAEKTLCGKIAVVPSADPGYDFLFTKGIAGLITKYGGINSHMAIRCAELGLPAVIGCGERNYHTWSNADLLVLDCGARIVRALR